MNNSARTHEALARHLEVCQELLLMVEQESRDLQEQPSGEAAEGSTAFQYYQQRKEILPRLEEALQNIQGHRQWWQTLDAREKQRHEEIRALIRLNQDLIMKVVYLDRENEKARMKQGLFSPHKLPPAQSQRPHFVADLYRRHHGSRP